MLNLPISLNSSILAPASSNSFTSSVDPFPLQAAFIISKQIHIMCYLFSAASTLFLSSFYTFGKKIREEGSCFMQVSKVSYNVFLFDDLTILGIFIEF